LSCKDLKTHWVIISNIANTLYFPADSSLNPSRPRLRISDLGSITLSTTDIPWIIQAKKGKDPVRESQSLRTLNYSGDLFQRYKLDIKPIGEDAETFRKVGELFCVKKTLTES